MACGNKNCRNSACRNNACRNSACRNSACRNRNLYPSMRLAISEKAWNCVAHFRYRGSIEYRDTLDGIVIVAPILGIAQHYLAHHWNILIATPSVHMLLVVCKPRDVTGTCWFLRYRLSFVDVCFLRVKCKDCLYACCTGICLQFMIFLSSYFVLTRESVNFPLMRTAFFCCWVLLFTFAKRR